MLVRDTRPGEGRRFEEIRIAGWHAGYPPILHPDRRGTGIGRALLEEGFARMPQCEQVLWVLEQNAPAPVLRPARLRLDGGRQVLPIPGDPVEVRYRRVSRASP